MKNSITTKKANQKSIERITRQQIIEAISNNNNSASGLSFSKKNLSELNLDGLNLSGAAFNDAKLVNTTLMNCELRGCHFRRANLSGARFWYSDLENADMQNADMQTADLLDANLHKTSFEFKSFGGKILQEREKDFYNAKNVYFSLRQNFSSLGRHNDVSKAYFKERQMERKTLSLDWYLKQYKYKLAQEGNLKRLWWILPVFKFIYRNSIFWLTHIANEIFWGYGERPLRTFNLAITVILCFTIIFFFTGGLESAEALSWLDLFQYSFASFVASGHGQITPASQLAQFFTSVETAFGVSILSLFLFTIGQRLSAR